MSSSLVELLGKLVAINSINPAFAGGVGEVEIAAFVDHFLKRNNIVSHIQQVAKGRYNVVGHISGRHRARSLLLNAHLDTVSVEDMDRPFVLQHQGDRLCGRGAYDMKGSVAIMLKLGEYFSEHPPPLDLWLTFVADEEKKSLGMDYLAQQWLPTLDNLPAGGIFLEPTEGQIGICHKGFAWCELEVFGKAAHGSRPERGIDAILPLHAGLSELLTINNELAKKPPDALLGHGSLHGGIINGGSGLSIIPAHSLLQWERRTLPGETDAAVEQELQRVVSAVKDVSGDHRVSGKIIFSRSPHQVDRHAEIVRCLSAAAPEAEIVGVSYWADSAIGGAAGIPSVIYGPAGYGAHGIDEWVSLQSLIRVYENLIRAIEGYA